MRKFILFFIFFLFSSSIKLSANSFTFKKALDSITYIDGKPENGNYLYVTASPKLYSIGNQLGQFPTVGFHVPGEMGGIWMHPVKLVDEFSFEVDGEKLNKANHFKSYPLASQFGYTSNDLSLEVTRTDFAADGFPLLVSELVIRNSSEQEKTIDVRTSLRFNLMPVWLSERNGFVDGKDMIQSYSNHILIVKDSCNNWFSAACVTGLENISNSDKGNSGNKRYCTIDGKVIIPAHSEQSIHLFISGSLTSEAEVENNIRTGITSFPALFELKTERYEKIDQTASISIPDEKLALAYRWGKYCTDWLSRDVPGMGRGLSAGFPDYPWFFSNDQSSTFGAIVGTCSPKLMEESLNMLMYHSNDFNHNSGRIIHEMSSNGQVYDKGRMEESQEFIHACWIVYKWTGDKNLLKKSYTQGLRIHDFLKTNDTDHNLYVEGYGGVEIEGLNKEMLDVACHTVEYLTDMSSMALEMNDLSASKKFAQKKDTLKSRINKDWWNPEENRYYDLLADSSIAIKLINKALKERVSDDRNLWAKQRLITLRSNIFNGQYKSNGYDIFYNPSTVALTTSTADTIKGRSYLVHVPFFCNKFGLYISGIARPDDITLEENSVAFRNQKAFNYNEAVMVGATADLAVAECMYNNADSACTYIHKILNNFSFATPGTTYEVCPDYGMFVQAWNVVGIDKPLIQYFFGLDPMASQKIVNIHPDMPSAWHYASISDVLIGDNKIGISFEDASGTVSYQVNSADKDWTFKFQVPMGARNISLNGKNYEGETVVFKGKTNTITFNIK